MPAEDQRTRLIGEIARMLREGPVPDDARAAALTFIGWLARRMPGEPVSHCDPCRCRGYAAFVAMGTPRRDTGSDPAPPSDRRTGRTPRPMR